MAICIYCPNEANSKEHWLPRGLGTFRGSTLLVDRLCEDCNNRLGRGIDQELMRTGLTGLHRAMLGIEGRSGKSTVSAFHYKTMQADQPTKMMMPALDREHDLLAEAYTDELGRPSARPIRQVVVKMPDGRIDAVPFARGWKVEHLKNAVSNRGLEGGTPIEVYVDDDENGTDTNSPPMIQIRMMLKEVFGPFSGVVVYGGEGVKTQNKLIAASGINLLYLRGVAKVGFHYFLWACPVLRGDEDCFAALRAFISKGEGDWSSIIKFDAPQFLPVLRAGNTPVRTSHFFHAALMQNEAVAYVQFFVGPNILPPPSRVSLAVNPLIIDAKHFACHQACYFDDDAKQVDDCDGELISIDVWTRRIVTLH